MTEHLQNNKGVIGKLLKFEIQEADFQDVICFILGFFDFSPKSFAHQISKLILVQGISLTKEEKKTIEVPIHDFANFLASRVSNMESRFEC